MNEGNTNKNIIPIKMEGEKTAKDDNIFRYGASNEADLNNKIEELNTEIQKAIEGKTDLFSGDIKALDDQIETKIDGLSERNNIQEILEYKKDINEYITKKAKIAGDLSPADSYIKGLMAQRTEYENQITAGSETVKAPMSGVVSYRVDNLENNLSLDGLDSLDQKALDNLNLKTGQIVASSNKIGKVVNNFNCYIAVTLKSEEAKNAKQGDKLNIRLSTGDEITAAIYSIKNDEKGNYFVIFNITECVEKLINYRKIMIDVIWWEYNNKLKVPNSAIIYNNGLSYVVRNRAGYLDKILIKILKSNNNYSVVDNYTVDELKELGFSSTDIKSMKNISMYDEIVLNPDLEKVN